MNIPLNIDWQQIMLHLFNFMILTCGLYILLYKPVRKFMAERTSHYEQLELQARTEQESALSMKAEWNRKLEAADAEIAAYKQQRKAESEKAIAEKEAEAEAASALLLEKARAAAESEKQRIVDSSRDEIASLAEEAVRRLLESCEGEADGKK